MSFPNPDNYARDCDCGTAGANTTPPPATIQADLDSLDTRVTSLKELPLTFTNIYSGSIDMRGYGGSIDLSSYGGSINTGTYGGAINTSGYNGTKFGGGINTSGTVLGSGGPINTSNKGGSIDTSGASTFSGGNINLSASGLPSDAPHIVCGTGVPSAALPNGSLFLRINGTASTTLYVRAAGAWSALS